MVPVPPTGFEATWPGLAADPAGDADRDGIANLIEYGLGLNPSAANNPADLPQPVMGPSGLTLGFAVPSGITDLNYAAECTTDMSAWRPVANSGSPARPVFTVPLSTGPKCFIRLRISQRQ